ncbi:hypothetical protein BDW67DRAFT_164383 [Aspergillus spinulosporus]
MRWWLHSTAATPWGWAWTRTSTATDDLEIPTVSRGRTRNVPHHQQRIGAGGHEIAVAGRHGIGRLNHEHRNNNARVKLLPSGTQIRITEEIFRSAHGFTETRETWTESDSVRVGRLVFPVSRTEYGVPSMYRVQYHVQNPRDPWMARCCARTWYFCQDSHSATRLIGRARNERVRFVALGPPLCRTWVSACWNDMAAQFGDVGTLGSSQPSV